MPRQPALKRSISDLRNNHQLTRRSSSLWREVHDNESGSDAEILVDWQTLPDQAKQVESTVKRNAFRALDAKLSSSNLQSLDSSTPSYQCLESAIGDVFIKVANAVYDINGSIVGWTWSASCREPVFEQRSRESPTLLSLSIWVDVKAHHPATRMVLARSYKAMAARPPTDGSDWGSYLYRLSRPNEAMASGSARSTT